MVDDHQDSSQKLIWQAVKEKVGFPRRYLFANPKKITIRKQIEDKIQSLISFREHPQENTACLISGPVGSGKSTLLAYICFRLIQCFESYYVHDPEQGKIAIAPPMLYLRVADFFDMVFRKQTEKIEEIKSERVLFLDDYGVEYPAEYPLAKFENFIEFRYAENLLTFITTNISPVEMEARRATDRVIDRFFDSKWMTIFIMSGHSQRS